MESDISHLVLPSAYRAERQHIFQSQSSFDWFVRKNKTQLVEVGALLVLTGRWFVRPSEFDQYLLHAGRAAAAHSVGVS